MRDAPADVGPFPLNQSPRNSIGMEMLRQYNSTHSLGHQFKCKYVIGLSLYEPEKQLALIKYLKKSDALALFLDGARGELSEPFALRATDVRWPVASADVDSVKAGSKQIVRVTGTQSSEYEITFVETGDSALVKTFDAIYNFMFPKTGLQRPPADYALKLSIGLGTQKRITKQWHYLVAMQTISLDASARDINSLMEIPVTFTQLDPYISP